MDIGDAEPTIKYLMKFSSEPKAEEITVMLWKPFGYNELEGGKSEFTIGGVTIPVMMLLKVDVTYFPCSELQTPYSCGILLGVYRVV